MNKLIITVFLLLGVSLAVLYGQANTGGNTATVVSGGSSGGASLTGYNVFVGPSNMFNGSLYVNTNSVPSGNSRCHFIVYTNGQNFSHFISEGQASGIVVGHRDSTSGAQSYYYQNGAGKAVIDWVGTGASGFQINGATVTVIDTDATGLNTTFGDGNTSARVNFNGTRLKVDGNLCFSGNVTNLVGTGLSNVVAYAGGLVTNRFTIP
jgi:hypothetical protein